MPDVSSTFDSSSWWKLGLLLQLYKATKKFGDCNSLGLIGNFEDALEAASSLDDIQDGTKTEIVISNLTDNHPYIPKKTKKDALSIWLIIGLETSRPEHLENLRTFFKSGRLLGAKSTYTKAPCIVFPSEKKLCEVLTYETILDAVWMPVSTNTDNGALNIFDLTSIKRKTEQKSLAYHTGKRRKTQKDLQKSVKL